MSQGSGGPGQATLRDLFTLAPKGTSAVRLLESLLSKGVYVKLNFWSDRVDSQN